MISAEWGVENPQAPRLHLVAGLSVCSFDALLNQLSLVLDARNLRGLVWFRRPRVFTVVETVGPTRLQLVSAWVELWGEMMIGHRETLLSRSHKRTGIFAAPRVRRGDDFAVSSSSRDARSHSRATSARCSSNYSWRLSI